MASEMAAQWLSAWHIPAERAEGFCSVLGISHSSAKCGSGLAVPFLFVTFGVVFMGCAWGVLGSCGVAAKRPGCELGPSFESHLCHSGAGVTLLGPPGWEGAAEGSLTTAS